MVILLQEINAAQRSLNIEYAIRDVVVPATELEAQGHSIIKLNIGDPIAYPGLPTPAHMVEAFTDALNKGRNGYSPSYGLPELREAIANDEKQKGWPATSDDVYVCHGVTEALQILFQATLEAGNQVLAPGPHYPPYMAYPQMYGDETIEYSIDAHDGWALDFDDIEEKMNANVRLFVLINPNNPTGAVIGKEEIERLLTILEAWPDCILVADEIYDGLDFSNRQVSAASCSKLTPVVTMNGVSKVYYAPGWRIGYMAIHDPKSTMTSIRDGIERILRSRLCASTPAQLGFLAGLNQDRSWMNEYSKTVKERRDVCLDRIASIEGLEVEAPEGAFYMFVRLTDEKWKDNDKEFVLQLLHEEHVLLVHGSGFSRDKGKGHVRLVFLPDVQTLHTAFDRIDSFLLRHRRT